MKNILGMIIFLTIFVVIYGGANFYVYYRFKTAFTPEGKRAAAAAAAFVFLALAPILQRLISELNVKPLTLALSHAAYAWMGLLLFFFFSSLALELANFAVGAAAKIVASKTFAAKPSLSQFVRFAVPAIVSACCFAYGYFEALDIGTEKITLKTDKLPPAATVKIAQISDLHLGVMVGERELEKIAAQIEKINPDMLVSTGDLVENGAYYLKGYERFFTRFSPPMGKFAVTGNHEYYADLQQALDFTKSCGFEMLIDRAVDAGGLITVAGVDDGGRNGMDSRSKARELALYDSLSGEKFILVLKHRPVSDVKAAGKFDLQLSGHTHAGQIWPFSYFPKAAFPLFNGLYKLSGGSKIYVSPGAGTWGPPVRFMAKPKVSFIELVSTAKSAD